MDRIDMVTLKVMFNLVFAVNIITVGYVLAVVWLLKKHVDRVGDRIEKLIVELSGGSERKEDNADIG